MDWFNVIRTELEVHVLKRRLSIEGNVGVYEKKECKAVEVLLLLKRTAFKDITWHNFTISRTKLITQQFIYNH